jgi:Leucine-rich repeat (LRR) protein
MRTVSVPFSAIKGYFSPVLGGSSCPGTAIRRLTGVPSVTQLLAVEGLVLDQITHLEFQEGCPWRDTDSLSALPELRVLSAPGARPSLFAANRSLEVLDLGTYPFEDLRGLHPVRHSLKTLRLESETLHDISELKRFPKLAVLRIWCRSLVDISALEWCTRLTTLNLSSCGVSDLSALTACKQLTSVTLSRCADETLWDLSALGTCIQLTTLEAQHCAISDLSALRTCANLTELDLTGNESLTDISALARCPSLQTLFLRGCWDLPDISSLAECPLLTNLDMTQCVNVRDIAPLKQCLKLRHLEIVDCGSITDTTAIGSMASLTSLYMGVRGSKHDVPRHDNLTDLRVFSEWGLDFARFPSLTTLHIESVHLVELAGIGACPRLRKLTLVGCGDLSDISGIENCPELRKLYIDSCESLGTVRIHNPSLRHLRINNCPGLSDIEVDGPRLTRFVLSPQRSYTICRLQPFAIVSVR